VEEQSTIARTTVVKLATTITQNRRRNVMKTLSGVALQTLLVTTVLMAQPKAVHFKKLQEFLPTKAPAGFARQKPSGGTQTMMGMTTSEARVRFTGSKTEKAKNEETGAMEERVVDISLEAIISDVSLVPFAAAAYLMQTGEYENETEEGYEKSITYKNFRGKESVSTTEYSKKASIELFVANRFLVRLQAENTDDLKGLYTLLDDIDLARLEKVQPQ
jgi:hypothetical protein